MLQQAFDQWKTRQRAEYRNRLSLVQCSDTKRYAVYLELENEYMLRVWSFRAESEMTETLRGH